MTRWIVVLFTIIASSYVLQSASAQASAHISQVSDEEFVRSIIPQAELGDSDSQYRLGMGYEFGIGVPKNHVEAAKWYSKAADQGNYQAKRYLGLLYKNAEWVDKNPQGTMRFWHAGTGGNCKTCSWTAAEGVITEKTPADFLKYFGNVPGDGGAIIAIHSTGGNLNAGLELGRLIRKYGLQTNVAQTFVTPDIEWGFRFSDLGRGECLSSCAYAFMGGKDRQGGKLGFHKYSSRSSLSELLNIEEIDHIEKLSMSMSQYVSGLLIEYIVEMGIDPRILSLIKNTSSDEMTYPTDEVLEEYNVISRKGLSSWSLEPVGSGVVMLASDREDSTPIEKVIFHCRKTDGARLLTMVSVYSNAEWGIEDFLQNSGLIDDWSGGGADIEINGVEFKIPKARVEFYNDKKFRYYRLKINEREANLLLNAKEVSSLVYWFNADGFHRFRTTFNDYERKALRIAWSNCL